MLKHLVVGLSALLVAAISIGRNASANGTFAVTLAEYNAALVAANNYVVTVPYGQAVGATYYNAIYTVTDGTQLEADSLFTITLPEGFAFKSQPSLSLPFGAATLPSSAIGRQSATFQITSYVIGQVIINALEVTTTQAFAAPPGSNDGQVLSMSVQATHNVTAANNDPAPLSQPAFVVDVDGTSANPISPFGGGQIDLAFPFLGNQFVAGGNDGYTVQGAGSVGTFSIDADSEDFFQDDIAILNAEGGPNSLMPSDKATMTVEGYFIGIGSAYADSNVAACSTTIPAGAISITVPANATSISFPGVPVATPMHICIIPNGVMWENLYPFEVRGFPGSGVTDFYGITGEIPLSDVFIYSPQPNIAVAAGTPQHTTINSAFGTALSAKVTDASNQPLAGVNVDFLAPYQGASGVFATAVDYTDLSVATNASGVATAPTFTANAIAGCYTVVAYIAYSTVNYTLMNKGSDLVFCDGFE